MTLVIPPGFAQAAVELRNDFDPESWFVTLGVDISDAAGDHVAAATNVAQSFEGAFQLGFLSNLVTVVGVDLRVGQDGGPPLYVRVNRGNKGNSSAEKLPQNCALLIRKGTARAGRTGRGRMYLPGVLDEGQVSQVGILSPTQATACQGRVDTFLANLADGFLGANPLTPMVLLHNDGVPGGTTPDPVISLTIDTKIATQRRRLR